MTGTWGRILARYGQSVTLRRGEEEQDCRAFLRPVRERREDWYQELPTPLGTVRRDQWLYLGPPELSLEETNGLCVEWNGLRFAVRAAQPVCVGEETLYWWPCWRWRTERRRQSRREGENTWIFRRCGSRWRRS